MSIDARPLDDSDRWNDLLSDTDEATPFHRAEALDVLAEHANADCHRLVGYKGQEAVGLFPVFTLEKGPMTAAFSPPPNLKIHYLGPALRNAQSLKRRRRDKRHRRFVDACLDWVEERYEPQFTQVRTAPGYDDVRPFVWRDFDATPRYTYVVDFTRGEEDLLAAFSSDARQNVTSDYGADYEIREEGVGGVERIVEQIRARHEAQDEAFPITTSFVTDLYEALPEDVMRAYVCRIDGEFEGGLLDAGLGDRSFNWLGGAKTDSDVPVNDLLNWRFSRDSMERGVEWRDLAGANIPRIAQYKAKFAPELVPYYRLQDSTRAGDLAAKLYESLL